MFQSHNLRAVVLCLLTLNGVYSVSQSRFEFDIPEEQAAVLKQIVEDPPSLEATIEETISPPYTLFQEALPIPPVKEPLFTITNPINGNDIQYYEIEIRPFTKHIYPDLGPAEMIGYDGMSPGPTFIVPRGTESVVRFLNKGSIENSVHLHGSYSRAPWDGWAEDITQPGEYKSYYYPNQQSGRFQWYHDHAMNKTAQNAYFGQAGGYILHDPAEDALGLPSGYGDYDVPLILSSKAYSPNGSLLNTAFGDVIHVNGQPWPFYNVEARKYRFRFLDASQARSFALYFVETSANKTKLPFKVIASDSGLFEAPVETSDLIISMGERYEIVFDFSPFQGQTIQLRNAPDVGGVGADNTYKDTDKVMRFEVASASFENTDDSVVPATLRDNPFPRNPGTVVDQQFRFHRTNSTWMINNVTFSDVENRLLANVSLGTVELWELQNNASLWTHPIHIHLVDFRVLERTGVDNVTVRGVQPYESAGLKDVVYLGKNEKVVVEAHYAPWPGVYMFHCHNLLHEDDEMMAAFNVTVLPDYGYNATSLIDPMQDEFRAKPFVESDVADRTGDFSDEKIKAAIESLANYQPYDNPDWTQA